MYEKLKKYFLKIFIFYSNSVGKVLRIIIIILLVLLSFKIILWLFKIEDC